jgi:hypothetical protein
METIRTLSCQKKKRKTPKSNDKAYAFGGKEEDDEDEVSDSNYAVQYTCGFN